MSASYRPRLWAALLLCLLVANLAAQSPPPAPSPPAPELKFLEAATTMANTLTSWAYAMIAGSIIILLGTGYYRPAGRRTRLAYLAFLPAWFLLYRSIQAGTEIQGAYLGALFSTKPKFDTLLELVNDRGVAQSELMRYGLLCFGVWLIVYLFWWIFNNEPSEEKSK